MGYHLAVVRTVSGQAQLIRAENVGQASVRMASRLDIVPDQQDLALYLPDFGVGGEVLRYEAQSGELWASTPANACTNG